MLNDDNTSFTDQDNSRTYPSYKAYKINTSGHMRFCTQNHIDLWKLLIYNNSDKKKLDALNNMELKERTYDTESLDDYSV